MAAMISSSHNLSTETEVISKDNIIELNAIDYAVLVLLVCVFIFGLLSWKMIEKFRHFKNFVLLNYMFASIIYLSEQLFSGYVFYDYDVNKPSGLWTLLAYDAAVSYMVLVVFCWITVLCWIFYVDIVKVFKANVNRRYLKSSLFAWGAPLTLIFISSVILPSAAVLSVKYFARETVEIIHEVFFVIDVSILFVPFIVNVLFYTSILHSLFRTSSLNKTAIKTRFYIATLIFFLSGAILLILPLVRILEPPKYVESVLSYLQTIALIIYFLIVKSNRDLWRVFYLNKLKSPVTN